MEGVSAKRNNFSGQKGGHTENFEEILQVMVKNVLSLSFHLYVKTDRKTCFTFY
jgi:hypothetical protein